MPRECENGGLIILTMENIHPLVDPPSTIEYQIQGRMAPCLLIKKPSGPFSFGISEYIATIIHTHHKTDLRALLRSYFIVPMTKLLIVTTSTIVVTVLFLFIRNFLLAFFLLSAVKGMFLKVTKNGIFENLKNYTFFKNCFSLLEF